MKAKLIILLALLSIGFQNVIHSQDVAKITTTITCPDECNGTMTIYIDPGELDPEWQPPFEVEYENLETGESDYFSMSSFLKTTKHLCAGEYEVIISLSESCEYVNNVVIGTPTVVPPFDAEVTCICFPNGFGEIDLNFSNDPGIYSFDWSGPNGYTSNKSKITGLLTPGEYTVTVKGFSGCDIEESYFLDYCYFEFSSLNEEVIHACDGPGTGQIAIDFPMELMDLSPPVHFAWMRTDGPQPAASQIQTDPTNGNTTLSQLSNGRYCLAATTNNGCSAQKCWTIQQYSPPEITSAIEPAISGSNGSINLDVLSSPEPIAYLWSTGATTEDLSNLSAGTYSVEIFYGHSENPCKKTMTFQVMGCNELSNELLLQAHITPMSSLNAHNATIDLTIVNGEGYPFIYEWTNTLTGEVWDTEDLSQLSPGEYCVKVILDNGLCPGVVLSDCFEVCNMGVNLYMYTGAQICPGAIYVASVSPSAGDYSYVWEHNDDNDVSFIYGPIEQTISVTITDAAGCSMSKDIFVPAPTLDYNYQVTNANSGQANGSIQLEVDGGTAPYTYTWDNGMTSALINGLSAGTYCVTIEDDCNSSEEICIEVGCEISPNGIVGIITPINCSNESLGAIELDLKASNANTLFFWSNGATTQNISDLSTGEYCVTMVNTSSGCSSNNCFEILPQGSGGMTASITVNDYGCYGADTGELSVQVSGGELPYTFEWINEAGIVQSTAPILSGAGGGDWQVIVTDANGCSATDYILLMPQQTITAKVSINPNPVCTGQTATAEVSILIGTAPFTFEWQTCSTGTTLPGTSSTMSNLQPGCYTVKVTDGKGCERTVEFEVIESFEMSIDPGVNGTCNGALGSISLAVSSGTLPYSYQWSNGQASPSINNLQLGEYCVTVTDAADCSITDCYVIEDGLNLINTATTDNICGSDQCVGAIDLTINMTENVTYTWSNGATTEDITGLCDGNYTVTITSGNCVAEETFTIDSPAQEFEYDVDVTYYFNNDLYVSGVAEVWIYSDVFTDGDVYVEECDYEMFVVDGHVRLQLPLTCSQAELFNFTYTNLNGCVYTGTFDAIPSCTFPDPGFSFSVTYNDGAGQGACGPGQNHSYTINVFNVGNNGPYFIEVSMDAAADPSESNYTQVVEYTGQDPFIIDGIPAGSVRFETSNYCEYSNLSADTHTNCCFEFSCDIRDEGPSEAYSGSYFYDLLYFRAWATETCFDSGCNIFDQTCSEIWLNIPSTAPKYNCWTGTVTVDYPDGPPLVFEVIANSPGNDLIQIISGSDTWDVPSEGSHFVTVTYQGNGASTGQDCQQEVEFNFYGETNSNDAVGFNDDFWFSAGTVGAPPHFLNSYFGSWICETCSSEELYFFENDQDACDDLSNWVFSYFSFEPDELSDPCNGGGKLTYIDFDADGVATIKTKMIPAGEAIDQAMGLQPFGIDVNIWCANSGWCLFDAASVYGFSFDKPLLATWAEQPCEEIVWTDPSTPNPDPCINSETDCPFGYVCVNGNCYAECNNGECLYGVCVDGICIEGGECNPSCPPGYQCVEGDCYLNEPICDFSVTVSGGFSPKTYNFYHNEPVGTEITFWYDALTIEDDISITVNGVTHTTGCTNGTGTMDFTLGADKKVTIHVDPCSSGSQYHLGINCAENFTNKPPNNSEGNHNLDSDGVIIHPNPFSSRVDITAPTVEQAFRGEIILLDNLGSEVLRNTVVFEKGYNRFNIDGLEQLRDGIYLILIKNESEILITEKLVKIQ